MSISPVCIYLLNISLLLIYPLDLLSCVRYQCYFPVVDLIFAASFFFFFLNLCFLLFLLKALPSLIHGHLTFRALRKEVLHSSLIDLGLGHNTQISQRNVRNNNYRTIWEETLEGINSFFQLSFWRFQVRPALWG